MTPIDWSMHERIRLTLDRGEQEALRKVLSRVPPLESERLKRDLSVLEAGSVPNGLLLPVGLRVDPQRFAPRVADWLEQLSDELRPFVVARLSTDELPSLFPLSIHTLLGFFSEAYRLVATGTAPDANPHDDTQYDGPPAVLNSLGGLVHMGASDVRIIGPEDVRAVAEGLGRVNVDAHPEGDVGVWHDYAEDVLLAEDDLEQMCRDVATDISVLYRRAARRQQGVLVEIV